MKKRLLLLLEVQEVSKLANPRNPEKVSQRAFDAAREQAKSQYPNVPLARHVARYLRLPWREILEIAHKPASEQPRVISNKEHELAEKWLTAEYVRYILKVVAGRLGVQTLTQDQYRTERDKLLTANKNGRLKLPTAEQIRSLMRREMHDDDPHQDTPTAGTWPRALALAGLEPSTRPEPAILGRKAVELLDRAYEIFGVQLTALEIRTFARANDIRYMAPEGPWENTVKEWKDQRRAHNLPVPDGPPPVKERPDYSISVNAGHADETRKNKWSETACVAVLVAYLEDLPPRQRATAQHYRRWIKEHPPAPDAALLTRHGGWSKVLALAHQEILKKQAEANQQAPASRQAEVNQQHRKRPKTITKQA
jgi:hypothetical protein